MEKGNDGIQVNVQAVNAKPRWKERTVCIAMSIDKYDSMPGPGHVPRRMPQKTAESMGPNKAVLSLFLFLMSYDSVLSIKVPLQERDKINLAGATWTRVCVSRNAYGCIWK